MKRQKIKDPMPGRGVSRAELAKFWDTHSIADYLDELKPVKVRFAKQLSSGITIRFSDTALNILRKKAQKKGIGPTTLARMWILERLAVTA